MTNEVTANYTLEPYPLADGEAEILAIEEQPGAAALVFEDCAPAAGEKFHLAAPRETIQAMALPQAAAPLAAAAVVLEVGLNCCLRNAKSGLYLDVANGSAAERSSCQQKIFNGTDHEVWVLISNIAGYYQLIPRHAPAKRLTVINGGSVSGGNVGIMQYSSKLTSQDWQIAPNSRGHYVVKSKCSNNTMVLCVDPNSAMADGANVAQYPYADDAAQQNDEWILEPFVLPCFEYDQGFFMYHAAYSGLAIQQALKAYGQEVFGILYNQFGLKARETFSEMTPSLSDDCHGMMYVCAHGYSDDCTNTFVTDDDYIHHQNWSKQLDWYAKRGRRPDAISILWAGHSKCYAGVDASGRPAHAYFEMAQQSFYAYANNTPFIAINLPLNVSYKQVIAFLLRAISATYGATLRTHSATCVNDPACNTATIYDAVLGPNPTQPSFWCSQCQSIITGNLNRFSKSGF